MNILNIFYVKLYFVKYFQFANNRLESCLSCVKNQQFNT